MMKDASTQTDSLKMTKKSVVYVVMTKRDVPAYYIGQTS
jgi:hypothetical protein